MIEPASCDAPALRTGVSEGLSHPETWSPWTWHNVILRGEQQQLSKKTRKLDKQFVLLVFGPLRPHCAASSQSPSSDRQDVSSAQPLFFSFFFFLSVLVLTLERFGLAGGAPSFLSLAFFTFSLMASMSSLPSDGAAAGTEEALKQRGAQFNITFAFCSSEVWGLRSGYLWQSSSAAPSLWEGWRLCSAPPASWSAPQPVWPGDKTKHLVQRVLETTHAPNILLTVQDKLS